LRHDGRAQRTVTRGLLGDCRALRACGRCRFARTGTLVLPGGSGCRDPLGPELCRRLPGQGRDPAAPLGQGLFERLRLHPCGLAFVPARPSPPPPCSATAALADRRYWPTYLFRARLILASSSRAASSSSPASSACPVWATSNRSESLRTASRDAFISVLHPA